MIALTIVRQLQQLGWNVEVTGGNLRLVPTSHNVPAITDEQWVFLTQHKGSIVKALSRPSATHAATRVNALEALKAAPSARANRTEPPADVCPLVPPVDADRLEAYEERAAIMEYDGKLPRQEAEQKAAAANRLAMPVVAGVVDSLRRVFGAVRVVYAEENGRTLGTLPPPGVVAHPPHIPTNRDTRKAARKPTTTPARLLKSGESA